jgi:hypothetical protein
MVEDEEEEDLKHADPFLPAQAIVREERGQEP